jgi:hypothetical protein
VFDVTLGIIYATVAFFAVKWFWRRREARHQLAAPVVALPHKQPA